MTMSRTVSMVGTWASVGWFTHAGLCGLVRWRPARVSDDLVHNVLRRTLGLVAPVTPTLPA